MNYIKQIELLTGHISKANIIYTEYAKHYHMTYNKLMIYYALNLYAPCTQKNIVEESGIAKQTVHTVIKDMIKNELVRLEAGDNKKEKLITLTTKGKTDVAKIIDRLMSIEVKSMSIFSDTEIAETVETIGKLTDRFEIELKSEMMKLNEKI